MLFWCRNCHASCIDPLLSSRQLWLLRVFCDPTHPSSNVYVHTWLIISITIWMQVPTEAKRTSDPLELEWQVVVSHPWILGTKPRSLSRTVMALNDWAISQAPFPLLKALEFKYTHTHRICGSLGRTGYFSMNMDCLLTYVCLRSLPQCL